MTKRYSGQSETIEIDENHLVIRSSRSLFSTGKTISIKDIREVELVSSPYYAEDTLEIHYGHSKERVRFSNPTDARHAASDITSIIKKQKQTSPLGGLFGLATTLFGIGASVAKADRELQQERELQEAEAQLEKAKDILLNSGKLTMTTYVNGKELRHPTSEDEIKALFVAEYAKSPRTVEQPWAQKWTDEYGIRDVQAYLQSVVNDGYLETAVLGKALSTLTGDEIKAILSMLSMKTSGAKNALIQRLVEEADSKDVELLLPTTIYALTDKGVALLRENQSMLADMWIECEKVIERGRNVVTDFKEAAKKKTTKKKRAPKKQMTDEEKLRAYKKSLKTLYEALKGSEIRETVSTIKAGKPTRKELEHDLRELVCASVSYSPVPYTETLGNIRKYCEFYSDEIIDQVYKGQTKYMLFDRAGFAELVRKISYDDSFDFESFIDRKWDKFVTEYMKTH